MRFRSDKRPRPPLDQEGLERLALFYAGRYASTRAKLAAYLRRKIKDRGWAGPAEAPVERLVERLVERFAELGYVDDRAFASARAASLLQRGYGARRVGEALRAAGIGEDDGAEARALADEEALAAAHRFARRRRLGPYADSPPDREARQKWAAAMLRAGHRIELVRRVLETSPADLPEPDVP
ncbi:MAG: RecX family transcriptional regulator [Allosphingosinicella sp.]